MHAYCTITENWDGVLFIFNPLESPIIAPSNPQVARSKSGQARSLFIP